MLSLNVIKGKTSKARVDYYTKEFAAESVAEQFKDLSSEEAMQRTVEAVTAAKERTRWWGWGAKQMGLEGTVDKEDLQSVLEGRNPSTNQAIVDPTFRQLAPIARSVGITRELTSDDIASFRKGLHPDTGEPVPRFTGHMLNKLFDGTRGLKNPVSAIDLTFSASKSVSLMVATGDTETREEAMEAHQKAVDAALRFVNGELSCVAGGMLVRIRSLLMI